MSWSHKRSFITVAAAAALFVCRPAVGQQKPQWMPGQSGLNAGVMPAPGFSYVNITVDYSSSAFNGAKWQCYPCHRQL